MDLKFGLTIVLIAFSLAVGQNVSAAGQNMPAVGQSMPAVGKNVSAVGKDERTGCEPMNIMCVCGIGSNKSYVPLKLETQIEDATPGQKICAAKSDPYQACANISCYLSSNRSESGQKGLDLVAAFYPIEFSIPPGDPSREHRFTRAKDPCHVTPLAHAHIKCWKWPNWINCDISCTYGHAMEDSQGSVTLKNINCRLTENVWKPHGFQDCTPYLNCKAHLVKPGNLKCKEQVNAPAFCEISCLDYDQFDATSLQKYECADENFETSLPHCAQLRDDVQLIKQPKEKF